LFKFSGEMHLMISGAASRASNLLWVAGGGEIDAGSDDSLNSKSLSQGIGKGRLHVDSGLPYVAPMDLRRYKTASIGG